jgi:hypothetical protein
MDDEWRVKTAEALGRIEQKVDSLAEVVSNNTRRFEEVEKRSWNQEGSQQLSAWLWTIVVAVATIAGSLAPVMAQFIRENFR